MSVALTFVEAPPGLAPLIDFTLDAVEGARGLHTMRSTAMPALRLFVIEAPVYLPWYAPEFDADDYAAVGASGPEGTDLLVVATLTDGSPVVNLMAPVLVNRATGVAAQLILGEEWPLQAALAAPAPAPAT